MVLEESVEVISFGGSVQKRVLSGFGVEKDAHGIELTEIQSENSYSTSMDSFAGVSTGRLTTLIGCLGDVTTNRDMSSPVPAWLLAQTDKTR